MKVRMKIRAFFIFYAKNTRLMNKYTIKLNTYLFKGCIL